MAPRKTTVLSDARKQQHASVEQRNVASVQQKVADLILSSNDVLFLCNVSLQDLSLQATFSCSFPSKTHFDQGFLVSPCNARNTPKNNVFSATIFDRPNHRVRSGSGGRPISCATLMHKVQVFLHGRGAAKRVGALSLMHSSPTTNSIEAVADVQGNRAAGTSR